MKMERLQETKWTKEGRRVEGQGQDTNLLNNNFQELVESFSVKMEKYISIF